MEEGEVGTAPSVIGKGDANDRMKSEEGLLEKGVKEGRRCSY